MRKFRIDYTFTFLDGSSVVLEFRCTEANLDIFVADFESRLNVFVDTWDGRRGSVTSFAVVEIDSQPEVKGIATSNRGVL